MQLMFMAVHSRYGRHYLKDMLCSTDSWRGRGSEEFTLPYLLQDMGELVRINRGGVVFSYLLSKNWWEPNLESRRQEICDDPSSVRSGVVVLQSVAPGPMACRARRMRGQFFFLSTFGTYNTFLPTTKQAVSKRLKHIQSICNVLICL